MHTKIWWGYNLDLLARTRQTPHNYYLKAASQCSSTPSVPNTPPDRRWDIGHEENFTEVNIPEIVKCSNGSDKCLTFCIFNEKIFFVSSEICLTIGVMLER